MRCECVPLRCLRNIWAWQGGFWSTGCSGSSLICQPYLWVPAVAAAAPLRVQPPMLHPAGFAVDGANCIMKSTRWSGAFTLVYLNTRCVVTCLVTLSQHAHSWSRRKHKVENYQVAAMVYSGDVRPLQTQSCIGRNKRREMQDILL